jgi:hypothetical protein
MRISHTNHNHPATPAARAACRDARRIALVDAVDAYRALTAHRRVRKDNNPTWRRLSSAAMAAQKVYAGLANITVKEASDMVRDLAETPIVD